MPTTITFKNKIDQEEYEDDLDEFYDTTSEEDQGQEDIKEEDSESDDIDVNDVPISLSSAKPLKPVSILKAMTQPVLQQIAIKISQLEIESTEQILALGTCKSGKTNFIHNFILEFTKRHKVAAIWWFGSSHHEESDWLNKKHRSEHIRKSVIDKIRQYQKTVFKGWQQLIICDDISAERFHRDDWYKNFITTLRHDQVSAIFGLQYIKTVSPTIRDCISKYIVCSANRTTVNALYDLSRFKTNDKGGFETKLLDFTLGQPTLMNTGPGTQELTKMSIEKVTSQDMLKLTKGKYLKSY